MDDGMRCFERIRENVYIIHKSDAKNIIESGAALTRVAKEVGDFGYKVVLNPNDESLSDSVREAIDGIKIDRRSFVILLVYPGKNMYHEKKRKK